MFICSHNVYGHLHTMTAAEWLWQGLYEPQSQKYSIYIWYLKYIWYLAFDFKEIADLWLE